MNLDFTFFFNNILLGIGLAADAFSVSLANGLHEPGMRRRRVCGIAGTFAIFQAIMPLIGWFCVHSLVQYFKVFEKFIPWIALALLCFIGGKMLIEGIRNRGCAETGTCPVTRISFGALLLQGVATSIDALSVGFTIADYNLPEALLAVAIIGLVTFGICVGGLLIGRRFGVKLSDKAAILGGAILIVIGIEIFVTGLF